MYHKLRQKLQNEAVVTNYCRIWCPKEKKFLYLHLSDFAHCCYAILMLRRFHEIYFLHEIKGKRNFKQIHRHIMLNLKIWKRMIYLLTEGVTQSCSSKKLVKNLAKFIDKELCQSLF